MSLTTRSLPVSNQNHLPMKAKLRVLLQQPGYRYLVVGVSVYIFELLVIVAAQRLGAGAVLAVGLSFWLGLLVSFGLQKAVTFSDRRTHHRVLLPQIAAFSLLVLFNFGFTLLVTKLLSPPVPAVITRTIALGITTFWNFYLYKTRIFLKPEIT
jgi:putative flippase GtrA